MEVGVKSVEEEWWGVEGYQDVRDAKRLTMKVGWVAVHAVLITSL